MSDGFAPTLLLHFNGPDGQTSFTSNDTGNRTVIFSGNAQLDTAAKKFGSASLYLDGNSDFVSLRDSSDFSPGSQDFTIDFQVNFSSWATGLGHYNFIGQYVDASNYWMIGKGQCIAHQNQIYFDWVTAGVTEASYNTYSWADAQTATWYHFAVTRSGATCRLFVNGTNMNWTEITGVGAGTLHTISANLTVGMGYGGYYHNGWLDEVRIKKGLCVWADNFPAPSKEYWYVYDTTTAQWLCNESNTSVVVYDVFSNYTGLASNNTVTMTTAGKVQNALFFRNSSGDRCNFGTKVPMQDIWTLSFWMRTQDTTAWLQILSKYWYGAGGTTQAGWRLQPDDANNLYLTINCSGGGNQVSGDITGWRDNAWHQIVVGLNSGTWLIASDGAVMTTGNYTQYNGLLNSDRSFWIVPSHDYDVAFDNFVLMGRMITNEEIAGLYNSGNGTNSLYYCGDTGEYMGVEIGGVYYYYQSYCP